MSVCSKCGSEIPENSKFCTVCGQKVEEAMPQQPVQNNEMPQQNMQFNNVPQGAPAYGVPQGNPMPAKEKKPFNKKLIIIIAAAVVAVAVLIVAAVLIVKFIKTKAKTVDFKESYIDVEYSGYDGYGTVSVTPSNEFVVAVLKAMGEKIDDVDDLEDFIEDEEKAYTNAMKIVTAITYTIDDNEKLSNGDEITVDISKTDAKKYIKKYDIILNVKDIDITLDGFDPIQEINPFDYVTMTYSGMSGNVSASCNVDTDIDCINDMYFSLDKSWGLSIGDTITVTYDSYYADNALSNGYKFTEDSKEFTITDADADRYVTKAEDIDDDSLEKLKTEAEAEIDDSYNYYNVDLKDINYAGMYVVSPKSTDSYDSNHVILVYTATLTSTDEDLEFDDFTVYLPVEIDGVVCKTTGETTWDDWYLDIFGTVGVVGDIRFSCYGCVDEETMYEEITDDLSTDDYDYEITGDLKDLTK